MPNYSTHPDGQEDNLTILFDHERQEQIKCLFDENFGNTKFVGQSSTTERCRY